MKDFPQFNDAAFAPSFTLEQFKLLIVSVCAMHNQPSFTDDVESSISQLAEQAEYHYGFKLDSELLTSSEKLKDAAAELLDILCGAYIDVRSDHIDLINQHVHEYCTNQFHPDLISSIPVSVSNGV